MTIKLSPQAALVLTHLQTAGTITQRDAILDYSIQSLTRRISELKSAGYPVLRDNKQHPITGQRYASYKLGQ